MLADSPFYKKWPKSNPLWTTLASLSIDFTPYDIVSQGDLETCN